jgi:hypothetical protein
LHGAAVLWGHDVEKLFGGSREGFRVGSQQLMDALTPGPLVLDNVPIKRGHSGSKQGQVEAFTASPMLARVTCSHSR